MEGYDIQSCSFQFVSIGFVNKDLRFSLVMLVWQTELFVSGFCFFMLNKAKSEAFAGPLKIPL